MGFTRIYSDGFGWTQVYTHPTPRALHDSDNLGFVVLAFLQRALRTNTDADLPRARWAFSKVYGDWGLMLVHGESTIK